jgi:hypothetical protein
MDIVAARKEQPVRHHERITDAQAELRVQLAHEREPDQGCMGDSPGDAAPLHHDVWNGVLGEEIIRPFGRSVDRK